MKSAQRQAILKALRVGPVSTFYARDVLSVAHPAGRVHELRASGLEIRTFKTWDVDSQGNKHLVAKYALVGGAA